MSSCISMGKLIAVTVKMAGLNLHPECQKMVDLLKKVGRDDTSTLSVETVRMQMAAVRKVFQGEQSFDGERTEIFIPSPDVKGGIPTYVYTPKNLKPDPVIFVFFHGGGLVIGSRDSSDPSCKLISSLAGCIVLNVEYRLAPEHKFPAIMDDAVVTMKWVKENKVKLGGTEKSKVGVGGESAGGGISASVAHDVPLDFQVLIYPPVTKRKDYSLPSITKYADGPLLTLKSLKWFENHYVPEGEEMNPRIASILRPKFDHLPPALVLIAEHDPLCSGSWMYAKKLEENGVSVVTHEYQGAIHGFFGAQAFCPSLNEDANKKITDFMQKVCGK